MPDSEYAFCESDMATSHSPWHIRWLTAKGLCLGGGIDTDSLCGRVKYPRGWDLSVPFSAKRAAQDDICKVCRVKYEEESAPNGHQDAC